MSAPCHRQKKPTRQISKIRTVSDCPPKQKPPPWPRQATPKAPRLPWQIDSWQSEPAPPKCVKSRLCKALPVRALPTNRRAVFDNFPDNYSYIDSTKPNFILVRLGGLENKITVTNLAKISFPDTLVRPAPDSLLSSVATCQ